VKSRERGKKEKIRMIEKDGENELDIPIELCYDSPFPFAGVAELADARDLKSRGHIARGGSIPPSGRLFPGKNQNRIPCVWDKFAPVAPGFILMGLTRAGPVPDENLNRRPSMAEKKEDKNKKEVSTLREYSEMIIEVLVLVFFINAFLLQSQTIPTPSMEDTMLIGDHLLVDKVSYAPFLGSWDGFLFPRLEIKRGMIVTFKGPTEMEKDYVKRVIGLPGEIIKIKSKQVYINGKKLEEPYVYYEGGYKVEPGDYFPLSSQRLISSLGETSYLPFYAADENDHIDEARTVELCERFKDCLVRDETGELAFKIPAGHYFCMGDNRDHSYDSRFWGPLPREYMLGRPWRIYWSIDSTTDEYLQPGIFHKVKDLIETVINFIPKTRWQRTFKKYE
jgi:signal peptidase I